MKKKTGWIAAVMAVVITFSFCSCGIHVKNSEDSTSEMKKSEPKEKTFMTSDEKYSLTVDTDWEDVLAEYKKSNKDMTLMLKNEMLYVGIIPKDKSEYDGLVTVKDVKDYADVVVQGMEEGTKSFKSTELKPADVGEYKGYYADANIKTEDLKLAYRMYFADTGSEYVEVLFWTDKEVFSKKETTIDDLVQTFKKNG
ncbi:MAG: hypothetical protein VB031_05205 [Eubacteriaceae bacterium]|nr:hypothetical protein [Eubacteriaceae bacterium]